MKKRVWKIKPGPKPEDVRVRLVDRIRDLILAAGHVGIKPCEVDKQIGISKSCRRGYVGELLKTGVIEATARSGAYVRFGAPGILDAYMAKVPSKKALYLRKLRAARAEAKLSESPVHILVSASEAPRLHMKRIISSVFDLGAR